MSFPILKYTCFYFNDLCINGKFKNCFYILFIYISEQDLISFKNVIFAQLSLLLKLKPSEFEINVFIFMIYILNVEDLRL